MTLHAHLRKETFQTLRDPVGVVVALLAPILVVWLYSLLELETLALPSTFRETSPVALVLCLSVWLSGLTMASTSLYREKVAGTLERLTVTPFSAAELIASKALVLFAISLAQSVLVWTTARWLVAGELEGARLLPALAGLAALGFTAVALGIALSAIVTSSTQISNAVTFLTLGVITLSGFFKPLGDLGAVGAVARLLPFTVGYRALQAIAEGRPLSWSLPGALLLTGLLLLGVAFLIVKGLGRTRLDA